MQHNVYLTMEPHAREAATVRGRGLREWVEHIDHLKRTGHLQEALDLMGECVNAAVRLLELREQVGVETWLIRSAIILRKLGDYANEVSFIESVLETWPDLDELAARLPRARQLLAKSASAVSP
jgi:hypothetical protein